MMIRRCRRRRRKGRGKRGKSQNKAGRRKERRGSFKGPRRFCRFGWGIVKLIFSLLLLHILVCDRRMGSAYAQSHTRASVVGGCLSLYRYRAVRRRCRYSGFLLLKLQQGKTFTRRKKTRTFFPLFLAAGGELGGPKKPANSHTEVAVAIAIGIPKKFREFGEANGIANFAKLKVWKEARVCKQRDATKLGPKWESECQNQTLRLCCASSQSSFPPVAAATLVGLPFPPPLLEKFDKEESTRDHLLARRRERKKIINRQYREWHGKDLTRGLTTVSTSFESGGASKCLPTAWHDPVTKLEEKERKRG